jgi:small subunit ribosomal protein S8
MDWISDGITRIRNAVMLNKPSVVVRGTKTFLQVLDIMKLEGFIKDYVKVEQNFDEMKKKDAKKALKQMCEVKLLYRESRSVIMSLKRVSKPSLRIYVSADELKPTLKRFVVPIVSTSKGMLSGRYAIHHNVGGELICEVG